MSGSQNPRRAVAEIRSGGNPMAGARIGNRSIHQFWYLYAPYFRQVLLAPHRRPDSDQVSWSWSEAADARPPTAAELAEVRRRLSNANQALADGLADLDPAGEGAGGGGAHGLESQVRANLQELITQLSTKSDPALAGFVCRTPQGLMLHSWGASTAAVPYYPDSRQGGINGTVWLDGRPAAGVEVVLRNKQGTDLQHATSGRDGAFGFPQVAPGPYRVRVVGRDDFPAEGEAVTVGHETIGGLELRGGASGPAGDRGASAGSAPASRRRWLAGLAVLALLGAGGLGWRHLTKPAADAAGGGKTPYSWQTASGKLVGSSGQEPAADAPKSGGAGAWADLSRTPAPPKILKNPPPPQTKDHAAADRAPAPSTPALAGPSLRVPEEKSPPGDGAGKNSLFRPDAKPLRGAGRAGTTDANPTHPDVLATAAAARAEPVEADARPPENKTTDPASASAARRQTLVSGNHPSPQEDPPATAGPSGEIQQTRAESFSSIPQGGSRSVRPARPAGPNGSGTANQAPLPAAAAESGRSATAAAGGGAESADQVPARSGAGAKERAGLARTTVTTAAALTASAGEATKENDEPAMPETAHDKIPANATARTGRSAIRPTGTPSPPAGNGSPAGRTGGEAASAPAVPALTAGLAKPAAAEAVRPAPGFAPASARPADDARRDGPWVPLGRVSASAWQPRLVRDLVLPTLPVPEGEDDALEALQADLLRKRKAQLPPAFRQPVTACGLAFELPSGETGPGGLLRWRDATGADMAGSSVQGNRAELAWAGMNAPRGTNQILVDATGREYVHVSLDQGGAPQITARPGVRTWYWVGIEQPAADPRSGPAEPRLTWRLLAGTADASGWPRDNRWRDGRGQRIDLPLGPAGVGPGSYALALVDPVTGWAIACDLTLR